MEERCIRIMENHHKLLEQELEELKLLQKESDKKLKKLKDIPKAKVYVSRSNGCSQYYINSGEGKKYVKASDRKLVAKQVQLDYELRVNSKLKVMVKRLDRFLKNYDIDALKEEYDILCKEKQSLIIPVLKPQDQLIEEWDEYVIGDQNYYFKEGKFKTKKGEMVKSKSEKIIADYLYEYGIPYKYEPAIYFDWGESVFPDFAILNVRTEQTIYWEHFGKLSDDEYAGKNFRKLLKYEEAGYRVGENMIITMESEKDPLNVKIVEEKILKYCR